MENADLEHELAQLEALFEEHLLKVFGDKEGDFSSHLRSLLFELWLQARDTSSGIAAELAELRELKAQRTELRELIRDELSTQMVQVSKFLKASFDEHLENEFANNLRSHLETGDIAMDTALRKGMQRILDVQDHGPEDDRMPLDYVLPLTQDGELLPPPTPQADDPFQNRLRERLRLEGLLPKETCPADQWQWLPMWFNTQTGEKAAFDLAYPEEKYNVEAQTVGHVLAWDPNGCRWLFPNPKMACPVDIVNHLEDRLIVTIDGYTVLPSEYVTWQWTWCSDASGNSFVESVQIPTTSSGQEEVRVRFALVEML